MNIFKRIKNLWLLSGIEAQSEMHKNDVLTQITKVLTPKRMATVVEDDPLEVFQEEKEI